MAVLEWDRNSEPDIKEYIVFVSGIPITPVPQTVSTKPSVTIDLAGKEGTLTILAVDKSGNKSGLSVPLPFDYKLPQPPQNLVLLP